MTGLSTSLCSVGMSGFAELPGQTQILLRHFVAQQMLDKRRATLRQGNANPDRKLARLEDGCKNFRLQA